MKLGAPKIFALGSAAFFAAYSLAFVCFVVTLETSQPAIKQLEQLKAVSGWIRKNTLKDEVILSWFAAPVAEVGERMPVGLEQGYHTGAFFCQADPSFATKYHIVTSEDIRREMLEGSIQTNILDSSNEMVSLITKRFWKCITSQFIDRMGT
jgi:hypothetical protein